MEVICESCKTRLNIPDEKIPKDQTVRINCPKCKNRITIAPPGPDQGMSSQPDPPQGDVHTQGPSEGARDVPESEEEGFRYEDYSSEEALDTFEEDVRLALVMADTDDHCEKIKAAVESLDYKYVRAPNIRDALGKIRFHHFHIMILADGFEGQELERNPVFRYMNHLSRSQRRRTVLAMMSDRFRTMDDRMAYAMSANVVINPKDADKLSMVLRRAVQDHERFYKVFMETLEEVGKA